MTRKQTSSRTQQEQGLEVEPLDDFLQSQLRWLDQMVSLQTTWLSSLLALQADCWRHWSEGSQQLPAWMVWHNGPEQLG